MCFKSVCLNIACFKTPYQLTILLDDCVVIENATIKQCFNTFCLQTNKKKLKIFAKYQNYTLCKEICLNGCRCQDIYASFLFSTKILQNSNVRITLSDANYGFPIARAMLNFSNNFKK